MAIELVKWRDAHFDVDQRNHTRNDYVVKTVGWTKDGPRFLRIVSERTPDSNRAVTYVPNENVIERKRLT